MKHRGAILQRGDSSDVSSVTRAEAVNSVGQLGIGISPCQEVSVERLCQLWFFDGHECGGQGLSQEVTSVDAELSVGFGEADKHVWFVGRGDGKEFGERQVGVRGSDQRRRDVC